MKIVNFSLISLNFPYMLCLMSIIFIYIYILFFLELPPIKAPVGLAPNPNLKNIRSKIGSFDNIKYKPGGGDKKVTSKYVLLEMQNQIFHIR